MSLIIALITSLGPLIISQRVSWTFFIQKIIIPSIIFDYYCNYFP